MEMESERVHHIHLISSSPPSQSLCCVTDSVVFLFSLHRSWMTTKTIESPLECRHIWATTHRSVVLGADGSLPSETPSCADLPPVLPTSLQKLSLPSTHPPLLFSLSSPVPLRLGHTDTSSPPGTSITTIAIILDYQTKHAMYVGAEGALVPLGGGGGPSCGNQLINT